MLSRRSSFLLSLIKQKNQLKFTTGSQLQFPNEPGQESERMKQFRSRLNAEIAPDDPLLIDIDPSSGEYVPECEKNPTKWGDWQIAGRVTDF